MTTYSTGNPVGSPDPRDLYDNAENLDNAANSDDATWTDRLGQSRRTMAGIEQDAITAIQNAGYVGTGTDNAIEDYASGIEITQYNQIVRDGGEFWRVSGGTALPYTLTGAGVPEGGALVSVGDAALRQDLADPAQGGGLVGITTATGEQTIGQLTAYLLQIGVPEWNGAQEFHNGSLTNRGGAIYVCLTDNHVSATPPEDDATNWFNATQVGQNIEVFDTAGVTEWNVPAVLQAGLRKAKITVIGGGGGGGARTTSETGSTGGTSSFGSYMSADGGTGGEGRLGTPNGGNGGNAIGGDVNANGSGGGAGTNSSSSAASGHGGASSLGGGARGLGFDGSSANGSNGDSYGGGGGGGINNTGGSGGGGGGGATAVGIVSLSGVTSVSVTVGEGGAGASDGQGGNGTSGIVIVEW